MPEGPLVRRFHASVSPFVGQQVVGTGGSSKRLDPASFQALWLQDSQVHGKKLFLRFAAQEAGGAPASCPPAAPPLGTEEAADREPGPAQPAPAPPPGPPGAEAAERLEAALGGDAERWLQVAFGLFGSVRVGEFSRARSADRRGDWKDPVPRLVLRFGGGGFLVFYSCRLAWCSRPAACPAADILAESFHRGRALAALGRPQPVCFTLLDQRHFSGLGNIIKNEALHRAGVHPLSLGSRLPAPRLRALLDHVLDFSAAWLRAGCQGRQQPRRIYQRERCPEGHQVRKEALGPPGGLARLTWWCPQCQPLVPAEPLAGP